MEKIKMQTNFNYGIDTLTVETTLKIARGTIKGVINDDAGKLIQTSTDAVNSIVRNKKTVYGSKYWNQ